MLEKYCILSQCSANSMAKNHICFFLKHNTIAHLLWLYFITMLVNFTTNYIESNACKVKIHQIGPCRPPRNAMNCIIAFAFLQHCTMPHASCLTHLGLVLSPTCTLPNCKGFINSLNAKCICNICMHAC